MGEVQESYKFNGKRMVVWYDSDDANPYPTKIRFMYNDWLSVESIGRKRRSWIFIGIIIGVALTLILR
jgi:hypothetical protein